MTVDVDHTGKADETTMVPPSDPYMFSLSQLLRNAEARTKFLEEFTVLNIEQVATKMGMYNPTPNLIVTDLVERKVLFAIRVGTERLFPAFQFTQEGQPKQSIYEILVALPEKLSETNWSLALWWATPSIHLDWERPVDLLDLHPEKVVQAAVSEREDWDADNPTVNQ